MRLKHFFSASPWTAAACLVTAMVLSAGNVHAAGFEYGPQGFHAVGRGGAFTLKADDASAMYWNPSRLSLVKGTQLHYSHSFTLETLSFKRNPAQPLDYAGNPKGDPVTFDEARQADGFFPMGISLGLSSDFGLRDWGFAIGFVGPSAMGKASFDDPNNDSATRYAFKNMDILMAFLTASVSWKYHAYGRDWFGLGVSFQYATIPSMKYSLDLVSPGGPTNTNHPVQTRNDLEANLDMSDWSGFSAIIGAWVRPIPSLEIALTARVLPINFELSGDIEMKGTQNSILKNYPAFKVPATLKFTYPMSVQTAIRYRHLRGDREVFDIEADFVWEEWSAMDSFDVNFKVNSVEALGSTIMLKELNLARNYQDTYSVRLGGQYNAIPKWLTVRLGTWWESAAHRTAYTMVDLPSFERLGIAAGLSTEWRGIEIGISYAHVFQMDRTVGAGEGRIYQQILQPDGTIKNGYAVNEGSYSGSFDIITIGLNITWETLVYGEGALDRPTEETSL
ncbi:MAG: hypothetical protein GXP54_11050 [Deltaproteobacteria bacterium]|nr:hypothetical protein [Deltaproteobacteria bacterium]